MKNKRTIRSILCNIIAWVFSAICLIPPLLIFVNSLKDKKAAADMNLKPPAFPIQWSNVSTVIEKGKLLTSFANSFLYAACAMVLTVFLASLAAWASFRRFFSWPRFIQYHTGPEIHTEE